jgi:translocation and assembly module TamB
VRIGKYLLSATLLAIGLFLSIWFWVLHTESGAAWVWSRVEAATKGQLSGEFAGGDFADGIEISRVNFVADTVDVSVESLRAAINVDVFPLMISLSEVALKNSRIELIAAAAESGGEADVASVLSGLRLPVRIDLVDASLDGVELLTAEGQALSVSRVGASLYWHNAITLREVTVVKGEDLVVAEGEVDLLAPQRFNLLLNANYDENVVHADISGDNKSAFVNAFDVSGADIDANGSATVRWEQGLRAKAKVFLARLNLNSFTEVWPESHPLNGELGVELTDEFVRFSGAHVVVANTDSEVHFDADFDRGSSTVSANLNWTQLQWPVDTSEPRISSETGSVKLSGDLDDWAVDGFVAVGAEEMPDGRFQIIGSGDRDHAAVSIKDGSVFGGSIAGDLKYSWRAQQDWSAEVVFENIQTAGFVPEWPGVVSGQAKANGTQTPFSIDALVKDVRGEIRGQALTANGSVAYANRIAHADQLAIAFGTSRFLLNGSADTREGLAFEGSVGAVEEFLDGAAGSFEANGRVSRLGGEPYLSVNLTSDEFRVGDLLLHDLSVSDVRADDEVAGVSIAASQLSVAGQDITQLEALVKIRKDGQSLSMSGRNRDTNFGFAINGAFDDWQSFLDSTWRGEVTSFLIDLEDEHALTLMQPAAVDYSSESFSIAGFCLGDKNASKLCVDAGQPRGSDFALKAEFALVPLALVEHVADTGLKFNQHINGWLTWSGGRDSGSSGVGSLQITPGSITEEAQSNVSIETGLGNLDFNVTDGELLSARVAVPLPGVGAIIGDFDVLDVSQLSTSKIDGRIEIQLVDIAIVGHLLPQIDGTGGHMSAVLELSGLASNPLVVGTIAVEDGELQYDPIGLHLEDIDLVGRFTEKRAIELSGTFQSGAGRASIVTSADYADVEAPGLHFQIIGDDLRLIDVPQIRLFANTDIEVDYSKRHLDIHGSILIPTARIAPANLAENRVSESEDVVIVAGSLQDEAVEATPEGKLQYGGQLEVELGKNVVIDLDIAKAKLAGKAVFEWRGPAAPIVTGRYDLSGSVQAFGQVLDITEGAVRYANTPAAEPYLRIRAEREIYGNSQIRRAGVMIDGPANHPTIEAYTNPLTTVERALTLLVTGSDFDLEQGVGAIDFGTYIAPKLFISYGVGIFDRDNVISARYDLSKGFGIKASSGSKESGVDLNYRFEN